VVNTSQGSNSPTFQHVSLGLFGANDFWFGHCSKMTLPYTCFCKARSMMNVSNKHRFTEWSLIRKRIVSDKGSQTSIAHFSFEGRVPLAICLFYQQICHIVSPKQGFM
jgi:hypothetical protein